MLKIVNGHEGVSHTHISVRDINQMLKDMNMILTLAHYKHWYMT
jgi:hypothetical protein